jgi:hypothetical protein
VEVMPAGKQFIITGFRNGARRAGIGTLHDDYSEESGNKCQEMRRPLVRLPHDGCDAKSLNGPVIIVQEGRKKDESHSD